MHLIVHTAFFSVPVFLCVKSASMSMPCMIVHVCVSLYVLKRKKNRYVMCCEGKKRKIDTLCAVKAKREEKKKKWPFTGKCLNIVCQNIKYI